MPVAMQRYRLKCPRDPTINRGLYRCVVATHLGNSIQYQVVTLSQRNSSMSYRDSEMVEEALWETASFFVQIVRLFGAASERPYVEHFPI
jgi:hypothetical protein